MMRREGINEKFEEVLEQEKCRIYVDFGVSKTLNSIKKKRRKYVTDRDFT